MHLGWGSGRPPSGFWVSWDGTQGRAWWPVNVASGHALPPPEELRDLPLDVLIDILTSARPLHRALRAYLKRRNDAQPRVDPTTPILDPHKRVDTSQFLLQRTRRVSWALNGLRERLERPVGTEESLHWRLRGPIGVIAVADALVKEGQSDEEKAFLLSELALELARVRPSSGPGCLSTTRVREAIQSVVGELDKRIPATEGFPANLAGYVRNVFEQVVT